MINNLKQEMKNIEVKIDFLCDKYKEIQNTRIRDGLSLAIYKCNDVRAKSLIEINSLIETEYSKIDSLKNKINEIEIKTLKESCIAAHKKIKGRFLVRIPNCEDIYVDSKQELKEYILKCRESKTNLSILEYIDYNNSLNKEVNMPYLYGIFSLDFNKDLETKLVPHQKNYAPYFNETKRISNGKVLDRRIRGYNSSNDEIFYNYMFNNRNKMCFHEPYSTNDCMMISKEDNGVFLVENGKETNYDTILVKVLNTKQSSLINKIINSLNKCKDYNYDIESIVNFIY